MPKEVMSDTFVLPSSLQQEVCQSTVQMTLILECLVDTSTKNGSLSKYSLVTQTFLTFQSPCFCDQTPRLLFFSLFIVVQLLIEGGVYFVEKPVDTMAE